MNNYFTHLKDFQSRFSFYLPIEIFMISCLGTVKAILEILTVTALIPLILIILDQESVTQGRILGYIFKLTKFEDADQFAILLTGSLILFFTLKLIVGIVIWKYEFWVLKKWRLRILNSLFYKILNAKYAKIQSEESSHIVNILSSSIPYIVTNLFFNLTVVANAIITFILLLCFSYIYSARTILIASLFGCVLIFIFTYLKKKRMTLLGERNQSLSKKTYSILQKSIFGLKETKLSLKQPYFLEEYKKISEKHAKTDLDLQFTQNLPTLIVEFISFVTILTVFIFLLIIQDDVSAAATEIAVLIFVGIRLIPLINKVISSLSMMASCEQPVRTILSFYDKLSVGADYKIINDVNPIPFSNSITFSNVTYSYQENAVTPTVSKVSFKIAKGQHIGLVGPSGAGKSTIVNILLGFLLPNSGFLMIDDQKITKKHINHLRKILSFVDQTPFLMNDTFINNIAYGEESENIDLNKVQSCLEKVGLWDHVLNSPNQLDFEIGENGKFLSGGQKQRLAIARALYKDALIIVLDEASSALDMDSEAQLSKLLVSLKGEITIISIAHRLSTLKSCDEILFIENGEIKNRGTFYDLYRKNVSFKRFIEHSNIKVDSDDKM